MELIIKLEDDKTTGLPCECVVSNLSLQGNSGELSFQYHKRFLTKKGDIHSKTDWNSFYIRKFIEAESQHLPENERPKETKEQKELNDILIAFVESLKPFLQKNIK